MNNNYKFETLQLHVGQEQPDPLRIPVQYRFTRPLPMSSATAPMRRPASG